MTNWEPPLRYVRVKLPTDPDEGPFTGPEIRHLGPNRQERRQTWKANRRMQRHRARNTHRRSPKDTYL